jgi:DNA repair exonuclease SbcCD ATPase subunit
MEKIEELIDLVGKKKKESLSKLRVLYATFNKIKLIEPDTDAMDLEEELEKAKVDLQVLLDRRSVLAGAGHSKSCPCCGVMLKQGYMKNLDNEIREQQSKMDELIQESTIKERTRVGESANNIVREINNVEHVLNEIKRIEKELSDIGII